MSTQPLRHPWDDDVDAYEAAMSFGETIPPLRTDDDHSVERTAPSPRSFGGEFDGTAFASRPIDPPARSDDPRAQRVYRRRRPLHAPNDDPRHARYVRPLVIRDWEEASIGEDPLIEETATQLGVEASLWSIARDRAIREGKLKGMFFFLLGCSFFMVLSQI